MVELFVKDWMLHVDDVSVPYLPECAVETTMMLTNSYCS